MNALAEHLKDKRITQASFAEALGVTQGTVSKLCRPGASIRTDMAVKIEQLTEGAVPATSWVEFYKANNTPAPATEPERPAATPEAA